MKLKKFEKIWLILVIVFYALYNLPFFPAYGDSKSALIHAILTLIPLWVVVYAGLARVFKEFPLKRDDKKED